MAGFCWPKRLADSDARVRFKRSVYWQSEKVLISRLALMSAPGGAASRAQRNKKLSDSARALFRRSLSVSG